MSSLHRHVSMIYNNNNYSNITAALLVQQLKTNFRMHLPPGHLTQYIKIVIITPFLRKLCVPAVLSIRLKEVLKKDDEWKH